MNLVEYNPYTFKVRDNPNYIPLTICGVNGDFTKSYIDMDYYDIDKDGYYIFKSKIGFKTRYDVDL